MNNKTFKLVISALLMAIGILIPMVSPIKLQFGPMSFTLGSHVAIIIAMFISPKVAIAVALGTTLGFFMAGFPLVVVLRAFSHVLFASIGAFYLVKKPNVFNKVSSTVLFSVALALIHALGEVIVVIPFYINTMSIADLFYMLFVLVGIGTILHALFDTVVSLLVWKVVIQNKKVQNLVMVKSITLRTVAE